MSDLRIFTRISHMVAQRDPLIFLIAYLGTLPIFACFYLLLAPGGFYAPYSRREPFLQFDKARVVADVNASVRRNVKRKEGDALQWTGCRFASGSVDIAYRNEIEVGRVPLLAGLPCAEIAKGDGSGLTMERANVLVHVSPVKVWVKGQPFFFHRVEHVLKPELTDYWKQYESKMVGLLFDGEARGTDYADRELALSGLHILLLPEEEAHLTDYAAGVSGYPMTTDGSFWRMLYLSAVVETTLGLGDIVPMTAAARILVALQAITGVILAGLFLNAAAYRASGR